MLSLAGQAQAEKERILSDARRMVEESLKAAQRKPSPRGKRERELERVIARRRTAFSEAPRGSGEQAARRQRAALGKP